MSSKLQLDVVTTVRGGAIWWMRTKAKGRHSVVCRLNCVIHVWAPWGRNACHLGRYINPRTFTFYLLQVYYLWIEDEYEALPRNYRCVTCELRMLETKAVTMQPRWAVQLTTNDIQSNSLSNNVQHRNHQLSISLLFYDDLNLYSLHSHSDEFCKKTLNM